MEFQDFFILSATTLGFISFCKGFLRFIRWIWVMFLRPPKNLKDYGSWAIITGCTDGIGKALALDLASSGLNLVLVGRNPRKLDDIANTIQQKRNRQVDIKKIVIDFAKSNGEDILRRVEEGIKGLDIGVLINNAGVGYPYARFFHEVDEELMESLVKVNIEGPMWVTSAVLPDMLKKKRGAVVNIGSGSSAVASAFPLYSIYAASKAYLAAFSRNTSLEYRQFDIDVQCQLPLLVATKMAKIKRSSLFVPSADEYSKASLRCIGYEYACSPYWLHSVQWFILQALPDMLVNSCIFHYYLQVRKRGLLKESMKQHAKDA